MRSTDRANGGSKRDVIVSTPYWWESAPPVSPPKIDVRPKCDVLIVGAGYTGLSAGLTLARAGCHVQIFDRLRPGEGASTRNGGIASGSLRPSYRQMIRKFGEASYGHSGRGQDRA